ncbi:MAG: hypothetical protein Q4D82_02330 [Neisseria sp.]|nr:hypothetical protein [Neisseria sp.]
MTQTLRILDNENIEITLSTGQSYRLREPLAKDMEGLGQDLLKIKHTDTVQKLVGRISSPQLTRLNYIKLSLSDAQVINAAIDFFSAPPAAKTEMQTALAELGYLNESESAPETSPQ